MDSVSKRFVVVGAGPGSLEWLTPMGRRAVEDAAALAGPPRLLDLFPGLPVPRIPFQSAIEPWLEQVAAHAEQVPDGTIAVLVSGDPGVSSLAAHVLRRFGRTQCRVVAGISSVQLACAALGLGWDQASVIVAHSAVPEAIPRNLEARDPWIILMGARGAESFVAKWIRESGRVAYRCEDLSLPTECVMRTSAEELAQLSVHPRRIVILAREDRDES